MSFTWNEWCFLMYHYIQKILTISGMPLRN
jgi:hypothetical protein